VRRYIVAAAAAVLAVLGLLVLVLPSGADVTSLAPWPGGPGSPSLLNRSGECNENLLFGSGDWDNGFSVQVACQMEIPAGMKVVDVLPSLPTCQYWDPGTGHWALDGNVSALSCSSTNTPKWNINNPAVVTGVGTTLQDGVATSVCNAVPQAFQVQSAEPAVYSSSLGLDAECEANSGSGIPAPAHEYLGCVGTGFHDCWAMMTQVHGLTVGPSEVASDGHNYQAVEILEQVNYNPDPRCRTCGYTAGDASPTVSGPTDTTHVGLGVPYVHPMPPDDGLSGSGCGVSQVNPKNDQTFGGVALNLPLASYDELTPEYNTNVLALPGFASSSQHLKLDGLTCSGTAGAWGAALPLTFFTGGSGSAGDAPCTLLDVTQSVNPGGKYTSGQSYSWSFVYVGAADQVAVDPSDTTGDNVGQIGLPSGGTPFGVFNLGTDSVVVPAPTNALAVVAVTFTTTGNWDPYFYCEAGGTAVWWGDALTPPSGTPADAPLPGGPGSDGGGDSGSASCFAAAGWSLTNPVSWVTGALHDGECILEFLFIPNNVTASALASPLTGHIPFSWVASSIQAVRTVTTGVTAGVGAGVCTEPNINPNFGGLLHVGAHASSFHVQLPTPSGSSCAGASTLGGGSGAGDLFGFRGLIRNVLLFGVWLAVFVAGWKMMPWAKPGDGVSMFAASGTINGYDANGVEVVQTNETSRGDWGSF
jgi:hypothetical protein